MLSCSNCAFLKSSNHPSQGLGATEAATIPFRLESDLTMVADTNKRPQMLCEYVCKLARERGFGEVELEDHAFSQKTQQGEPRLLSTCSFFVFALTGVGQSIIFQLPFII